MSREDALLDQAMPYLEKLLRDSPDYGSAGLSFTLHEGRIVKVDLSTSVSLKTD